MRESGLWFKIWFTGTEPFLDLETEGETNLNKTLVYNKFYYICICGIMSVT